MKMIDRFKAKSDFERIVSVWYFIATATWLLGLIILGPFYTMSGLILLAITQLVTSGVRHIASLEFKFRIDTNADIHNGHREP